jgi:hypothetical protein
VGLGAAIVLVISTLINQEKKKDEQISNFFLLCVICILLQFLIVVFYNQGGLDYHPMNGRFYLALIILLSILPLFVLYSFFQNKPWVNSYGIVSVAMIFFYYHPIAMEDRLSNNLFIIRENRFVRDFLNKNADKNALIICDRPGQIIVYNRGAISISRGNDEKQNILLQLKNHLFSNVYVIQDIAYTNHLPLKNYVVDHLYKLERVAQLQTSGNYFVQISRVVIPEEVSETLTSVQKVN